MSVMRVVCLVAIGVLLAPVELSAQRLPLPGVRKRGPARPAPLPPQVEPVARSLAYKRLPFSVESYPLISYVRSPVAINGSGSDWTSLGTGTRADYRVARHASLTLDVTSSFAGGPANLFTAEIGTRLGPERSERRVYHFVDVRAGYIRSYNSFLDPVAGEFTYPAEPEQGLFRYSSGFGGVAGVGLEYALTRSLSLTTAGSIMRNRMTTSTFFDAQPGNHSYTMTLYRYTLGIRYNPVRVVRPPFSNTR